MTWSATTCEFPGAGLYVGLAPAFEHALVARGLSSGQARVYTGGTVRLRAGEPPSPLVYFAIRDPSAVSVKPLDVPPLANGFRHVLLVVHLSRPSESEAAIDGAAARAVGLGEGAGGTAGFIMTVGLPPAREERFFADAVGDHPEADWGAVFRRMALLRRLETA